MSLIYQKEEKKYDFSENIQNCKSIEIDIILSKYKNEIINLKQIIIGLQNENSELKKEKALRSNIIENYKKNIEVVEELKEKNSKLYNENESIKRDIKLKLEKIELEKELFQLKTNKDMSIYNQKINVIRQIEMDNDVYREEVKDLKNKNNLLGKEVEEEKKKLKLENKIKFKNLKSKLVVDLEKTKDNINKINLEFLDLTTKLIVLQNTQLLSELEIQKIQIESLLKQNKEYKNEITELEKEIDIHKRVELKLAGKNKAMQSNKEKNNIKNSLNECETKYITNTNSLFMSPKNKFIKSIILNKEYENSTNIEDNIITKSANKNDTKSSKKKIIRTRNNNLSSNKMAATHTNGFWNDTQFDYKNHTNSDFFTATHHCQSVGLCRAVSPEERFHKYANDLKNKKEEIDKLKTAINSLNNKINSKENKYKGLVKFLDECLTNFFSELTNKFKEKFTSNIDIDKIKFFNFEEFSEKEKYSVLVLLINSLLPLIPANFSSRYSLNDNLFKTNLNIIDKAFNKNSAYLQDKLLKNAFISKGNKLKKELYIDKSHINYSNSIPVLRKFDTNKNMIIQNDKYKALF